MKTILNTLIALFILFLNTESFAKVKHMDDHSTNCIHSFVPVSPRDWTANDSEVPENLKFVKAKSALVPVAEFVWGNPDAEAPAELAKDYRTFYVPVPAKVWEETAINEVPESLGFIKAKFALVQVPARTLDGITISADEIIELNKI
ncbi:MAG: hypothetical protein B7X86_12250 [Sphingobacteriales bacterium 17-39-43]|uniref:hypothetical protein n=1 Tax=Daejeonella sp. TaxID=2805397 RepID=UPI000BCEBF95|nr:hypothetical protein [Daejeonella sp.]OYZ30719.1 MAG: hypothetical protein B7Y24_12130 [Sphingobacteriales bacterium 16-39-50]OZA23473.1 MAG: hypothetical protein B7X86_12250 [Sphingobacteriales bacterium 17-39-43]OZA61207.1 MAG: hypothetical protein B7X75_02685 [Sphingobacteriales bacterium 39-40-5]HQS51418.1 hypothetical protein [Daejeonella sp.]HQT23846.1 hypothetical protein [Daejeonella sp.]